MLLSLFRAERIICIRGESQCCEAQWDKTVAALLLASWNPTLSYASLCSSSTSRKKRATNTPCTQWNSEPVSTVNTQYASLLHRDSDTDAYSHNATALHPASPWQHTPVTLFRCRGKSAGRKQWEAKAAAEPSSAAGRRIFKLNTRTGEKPVIKAEMKQREAPRSCDTHACCITATCSKAKEHTDQNRHCFFFYFITATTLTLGFFFSPLHFHHWFLKD